jgi:benzylsuccinate CoA-transferase BbsE subunit
MNTSKRAVTLDVTQPQGQALFMQLARTADLIVETFEPGFLSKLGIGYDALRAENPQLVFTSITGFGQTGPYSHFKCSELVANALGGTMALNGEAEDPPVALAGMQAYVMAASYAAVSSLIALYHSRMTGQGQQVDISAEEVNVSVTHICGVSKWHDDHLITKRMGTALFASTPSGAFRCKDGLIYLMINRPLHWKTLAQWIHEVTGNGIVLEPMFEGPSSQRQPYRDLIDIYVSEFTSCFNVDDLYHEAQRRHLPLTPIHSAVDVANDSHLAARNYFVPVSHAGGEVLRYPGPPYRHAATPWAIGRCAPCVGEHNEEIYCRELGLTPEAVQRLATRGII